VTADGGLAQAEVPGGTRERTLVIERDEDLELSDGERIAVGHGVRTL